MRPEQVRTYDRAFSVVFLKTDAPFGGLSNMAGGFPLWVNGIRIFTSEALYQACRFPHRPEVQALIIEQRSPMTAKMKSKPYRHDSRPDWDQVRVKIMRWCLRVKLAQNWRAFSELLLETGERAIVEESRKDAFWGAKATDDGTLVGMNVLGRLLMELREAVRGEGRELLMSVQPLGIPDFLLGGRRMEIVTSQVPERDVEPGQAAVAPARGETQRSTEQQSSLFETPAVKEAPPAYSAVRAKSMHGAEFKPYADYKESGLPWLGPVPMHWHVSAVRGLFRWREECGGERAELLSLSSEHGVRRPSGSRRRAASMDLGKYRRVQKQDLVVNRLVAKDGALAVSELEGIVSPAYWVLQPRESLLEPHFCHHLMRSSYALGRICQVSKWQPPAQFDVMWPDFRAITLAVPPIEEQSAIGRFLDWANGRLDRAIRAKRKVVALLAEQKQAIIHRAVTRGLDPAVPLKPTGIPWLGDIPQHWEVRRLGRLSKVFNGSTPSRAQPKYWVNGTIPWLSSSKVNDRLVTTPSELITSRALASCSLSVAPSGAVLVGLIGQGRTRGMCALLAMDACISQNLAAAVPGPHVSGQYLYYALLASYSDIREFGRGGNQAALNCEIVGRLPIPVPPLEEQRAINGALAAEVQHLQPLEGRLGREIELLREYRNRLVADVVTGKLDVREAAARLPDEAPLDTAEDDADLSDEPEAADEAAAV